MRPNQQSIFENLKDQEDVAMKEKPGICRNCWEYPIEKSALSCPRCGIAYPYTVGTRSQRAKTGVGFWLTILMVALVSVVILVVFN